MRTLAERESGLDGIEKINRYQIESSRDLVKEALRKKGLTFFHRIQPVSFRELLAQRPEVYDCANPSGELATFVPQGMDVAINPKQLYLPGSINSDQVAQMKMIEEREMELQKADPRLLGVKLKMMHVSVYAQLDEAYQKATGEKLFTKGFARALDSTGFGSFAYVGRAFSDQNKLIVNSWNSGGNPLINAAPVAVLPRR